MSTSLTQFVETEAGQLASAVVDVLNDGTIALPTIAERYYLPSIELTDPLSTSVLVAATSRKQERETRGGMKRHVPGTMPSNNPLARYVLVEIGISKKFGEFADVQSADPIARICEQVADLLGSIRIDVTSDFVAFAQQMGVIPAVEQDPFYDPSLWKENQQFTGIVKVNYRVIR